MVANNTSVLLIYTGGTIGMIENPETGALENFNMEQLQKHIPELQNFGFCIDTYQFDPPMDSSDMDPEAWQRLVRIISDHYDQYTGFVILHGTDTMAYTASALSFMLENLNKPVILTGSQLPIGVLRTDGKENLLTSIEIATACHPNGRPVVPEVCIFFENHLMRGNRTTKMNAENFNAFRSFNYPNLASAGIHIKYNNVQIHAHPSAAALKPHYLLDTNIAILKLFPGIQENIVASLLATEGLKAVVLETYGSGNAPRKEWFLRVVPPSSASRQPAGNRHCQRHPMPCRHGRDGTLRDGLLADAGRRGERLRQHHRIGRHQADVPPGPQLRPRRSAPPDDCPPGRRNHRLTPIPPASARPSRSR